MTQKQPQNYSNEIWLPIRGYTGNYEISNRGRVKSLPRYVPHSKSPTGVTFQRGRILKPSSTKGRGEGYYFVGLRKNGSAKYFTIHRLVAKAFLKRVRGKRCVNHKDCDIHNNNDWNLEWMTQAENNNFARSLGRIPVGEARGDSKLTTELVVKFRTQYKAGKNLMVMAKEFGVDHRMIHNAAVGKIWKHVNKLCAPAPLRRRTHNGIKLNKQKYLK
jgi:hypothetical protein